MHGDVEKARVASGSHPTLFPLGQYCSAPQTAKEMCDAVGLNWFAAEKLYEDDLLSFDPNAVEVLTLPQRAELRFLGTLVTAGCPHPFMVQLLADLEKPYCYRLDRMYFDWDSQLWQILRADDDVRLDFERWLNHLIEADELEKLERLRDSIEGAIFKLRKYYSRLSPW